MIKKISIIIGSMVLVSAIVWFTTNLSHKQYATYSANTITTLSELSIDNDSIQEIIDVIEESDIEYGTLNKYGYHADDMFFSTPLKSIYYKTLFVNLLIANAITLFAFGLIYIYKRHQKIEIEKTIKYINDLKNHNQRLELLSNNESDISKLKNELYRVTVSLANEVEKTMNEKLQFKDNIVDVSHQLKTPLTSVLIMLDNIIDDKEMPTEVRNDFINEIKVQIENMEFLILNLLKLSKFDAEVIEFIAKPVKVETLLNESLSKVQAIAREKNCVINTSGKLDAIINIDLSWQVEAISNIIKNGIEHSYNNSSIDIQVRDNNFYTMITIKDYGCGIVEDQLTKIFNRFYKGNISSNNIGVGLHLARTIISKENGTIDVDSTINIGTTFTIKYFKNNI